MKKLLLVLAFGLAASIGAACAQDVTQRVGICDPTEYSAHYCAKPDSSGNLPVTGTLSASIGGFPGISPTTRTPISVTTGGVTGTLPAGTVVVASNVGATNGAYCKLGASATTSDQLIPPNSWFAFTVGSATQLTCITSTSTTTVNMTGGAGIPTGAGGGGGGSGGGGAITAASGAFASGSISSGAIASGAVASGAFASGSVSDGAVVTLGAKADAKSTATDTTAITAMQVLKEISAMEQAPASRAVTNAGTFAVQNSAATPAGANIIGKVSQVDSGGTDATDTTNHAVKVNVVAGGAGGGAVYGPTAVGSAAANPPILMAGTANAGATGNVQVVKVDSSGNAYVKGVGVAANDATSGVTYSPVSLNAATACNAKSYTNGQQNSPDMDLKANVCGDVAALGGTAIDTNSGNKSAGTQRAVLATDSPAIPLYGQGATGAAVPSGAVYSGANIGGNLTGLISCQNSAIYDASTNGSTQLVALSSGKVVYVCGYSILASGTVNVELDYGTGTACATGNNKVTPAFQLTAQVGIVDRSPYYQGLNAIASNELCIKTSAGVAVQAIVYYSQF